MDAHAFAPFPACCLFAFHEFHVAKLTCWITCLSSLKLVSNELLQVVAGVADFHWWPKRGSEAQALVKPIYFERWARFNDASIDVKRLPDNELICALGSAEPGRLSNLIPLPGNGC